MYAEKDTLHSLGSVPHRRVPLPHTVALTGFARSGKDTVAEILGRGWGYQRLALADPLRDGLYALNPIVFADAYGHVYRVKDVVDECGWDEAKKRPEVRTLLQRMGTEFGRKVFGDDIWVDTLLAKADALPSGTRVVVTDCRFDNEARRLGQAGALVVRVTRPGVGPVNDHASDRGLSDMLVDYEIVNDGTLDDLAGKVARFVAVQAQTLRDAA